MQRLFRALQQTNLGLLLPDEQLGTLQDDESLLQDEELADLFWLADKLNYVEAQLDTEIQEQQLPETDPVSVEETAPVPTPLAPPPTVPLVLNPPQPPQQQEQEGQDEPSPDRGLPIEVRAASALPNRRDLGRALRPLMQQVPSLNRKELDVAATVKRIAQRNLWVPVMRLVKERWLDLELVVDDAPESVLWQPLIDEFRLLLERQGAFRNVRTWRLGSEAEGQLYLKVRTQDCGAARSRRPGELISASGRRLVLLVSDCCGPMWQQGAVHDWLRQWNQSGPTAVLQLMPERMWGQSALNVGYVVQVSSMRAGAPNTKLRHHGYQQCRMIAAEQRLLLPLTMMTPMALHQWATMVAAIGQQRVPARLFDLDWVRNPSRHQRTRHHQAVISAEERVALFYARASEAAQELAEAMALFPVSLDVVYLLQGGVLTRRIEPVHVAEVYRSGLLVPQGSSQGEQPPAYDFEPDVRERLYRRLPEDAMIALWNRMSIAVGHALKQPNINSFSALLSPGLEVGQQDKQVLLPFARVMTSVLHRLGGDYATLARMHANSNVDDSGEFLTSVTDISPTTSLQEDSSWRETLLRCCSLLQGLPPESIELALAHPVLRTYPANHVIIFENDDGGSIHFILKGWVIVRTHTRDGKALTLHLLSQGDLFGEMAVLDAIPRSADVITLRETQTCSIPAQDFLDLLRTEPMAGIHLSQLLAFRLRQMNRLMRVREADSTARLVEVLLLLADGQGWPDDQTCIIPSLLHRELSTLSGLELRTVSRVLRKLEREGLVLSDSEGMRIPDLYSLSELV